MLKSYTGDWQKCPDNIEGLLAIGVEVRWTKCWRYDFCKDATHLDDRKWQVLKDQRLLEDASWESRTLTEMWWGTPHRSKFRSYCVISYRIDDEKYPLFCARYREWEMETDEMAHLELERMHQEWVEEHQRKLDAYLKKYPWRGEPEYCREGWDYLVVNDPDKGEITVDCGERKRA